MSVFYCDGLYGTDSHIHTKGRCTLDMNEDDWLWLPERSLQCPGDLKYERPFSNTQTHNEAAAYSLVYIDFQWSPVVVYNRHILI